MKIGVFDSGLGGLMIFKSVLKKLPQYDYIYLGDTQRVPYGNRSHETVYRFTEEAVDFLFKKGCQIIIVACGTASSRALRKIQQEYLPKNYLDRRVLGIVIPLAEEASPAGSGSLGVLATAATVSSKSFLSEVYKINPKIKIFQQPAPLLVPLIEGDGFNWINPILKSYLDLFLKKKANTVILGCTHYPIIKDKIKKILGKKVKIISPDNIIPVKLKGYLARHPEIEKKLTQKGTQEFLVTDKTENMEKMGKRWFGKNIKFDLVKL